MSNISIGDIFTLCISEFFKVTLGSMTEPKKLDKEDATKKGECKKKEETEAKQSREDGDDGGESLIRWINSHGHIINVLATAAVTEHGSRLIMIYLDKNSQVLACDQLSDAIATAMFPDEYPPAKASAILTANEDSAKAKAAGGTGKEYKWCVLTAFIDSTQKIVWTGMPFQARYMHLKREDSSVHQLSFTEVVQKVFKPRVIA
jgi:hypothetical protein